MKKKNFSPLQQAQQRWVTNQGRIAQARINLHQIAKQLKVPTTLLDSNLRVLEYANNSEFISKGGTIPRKETK